MTPPIDFTQSLDYSTLAGKSVLITGGASGIGALCATTFAQHGAFVTICDVNDQLGTTLAQELNTKSATHTSSHPRVQYIHTDVTSWSSQISAFKSAIRFSDTKSVDIVVAAAGLSGCSSGFEKDGEEEPASLDHDPPEPKLSKPTFDVNALGVWYTARLAMQYFTLPPSFPPKNPFKKTVILIASLAAYLEINSADYTSSKWAVRGIFRSLRSRFEDKGWRLNLIAPWVMDTPMSRGLAEVCRREGFPVGEVCDVVGAVVRCAVVEGACGRAIGVGAEKTFDLRDDVEGLNGGTVMKEYLEGEAREFMAYFGQRP